jgi:hypothetical protein
VPKASLVVIVACAALLSGCGVGSIGVGENERAAQHLRRADLAHMVGPKRDLGPLVKGLRLDNDDTGRTGNASEADSTVDPKDTGHSLGHAGRVEGYALGYSAPDNRPTSLAVLAVDEEVELFRTEEAASAYLKKQIGDYVRFEGRKIEGIKIARAETFDSDVGDEARGLRAVVKVNGLTLYGTIVAFRRGRVVGNASVLQRRDLLVSGDVDRIADALDDRVQKVGSRPLGARSPRPPSRAKAVKRTIDPKPFALTGKSFSLRMSPYAHDYVYGNGVRGYVREYSVVAGRLAGSKVWYVRTLAEVFPSTRAVARSHRYAASTRGATTIARRFLNKYFARTDFRPGKVTAAPLSWKGRDTAGFHFLFRTPKGRVEGVFLSVDRGRVTSSVTVLGFDREVDAQSLLSLQSALRAQLAHRPVQ